MCNAGLLRRSPMVPSGLRRARQAYELMNTGIDPDEWKHQYRTLMARYVATEGPAETAYLDRL